MKCECDRRECKSNDSGKCKVDDVDCEERISASPRSDCYAEPLRKASFLVGNYDPCLLCANRTHCGGAGCLGWEPDEDACQDIVKIKWHND